MTKTAPFKHPQTTKGPAASRAGAESAAPRGPRAQPLGRTLAAEVRLSSELLNLRAELHRAEKAEREAKRQPPAPSTPRPGAGQRPLKPQREADLQGMLTDDFSLARAHRELREAVYDGRYRICPHAVQHARAEGFMEPDIMQVLLSGRVRAVYPEERRWLVCGFFEACGIRLPLHVVVQVQPGRRSEGAALDIVTAFVPKHPHQLISRARLALLLRYDDEQVRSRAAVVGNRVGYRGKGGWK